MRYCKSTIFQANHNALECRCAANYVVCDTAKVRFFKQITTTAHVHRSCRWLFAILQKYDFSSKSQRLLLLLLKRFGCLRYCKSTIFQANHNQKRYTKFHEAVVCDTAKVRFFKQITTMRRRCPAADTLFAILQKYDFSSKSQLSALRKQAITVVCDTAKVRFFKQITTLLMQVILVRLLFAILQKYDFSSKSQPKGAFGSANSCCLRYCKSTIFQANHNIFVLAKFKKVLFAILQKYDFSSKSQPLSPFSPFWIGCLRYCKSTIFQANHNRMLCRNLYKIVVCDTAKVRFFKQITTLLRCSKFHVQLFAILQKYDFSSKSQLSCSFAWAEYSCLRYCKSTIFQANHN